MMYVILDSNIIIEAGYGRGAMLRFFLSVSKMLNLHILVSPIVIDEVVARYRASIEKETRRLQQSARKLSNLLPPSESVIGVKLDLERTVMEYRKRLELSFSGDSEASLCYPTIGHSELVARALMRRRPFNESGSGYRDTLIWLSIVEFMSTTVDHAILITADGAFMSTDRKLHADLAEDLAGVGRNEGDLVLATSLSAFVDAHVRPRLRRVFRDDPVQSLGQLGIEIQNSIEAKVYEEYSGVEMYPEQLNLPAEFETLYLAWMPQVSNVDIVDVREVSTGSYLLQCECDVDCEFEVFVHKADAYTLSALTIYDPDWNDHYVAGHIDCQLRFELELRVAIDTSGTRHHSMEILEIDVDAMGLYAGGR